MTPLERLEWLSALVSDRSINENAIRLGVAVADRTHVKTGRAFVAQSELAAAIGASVQTVRRAGRVLEQAGWLLVAPGRGRGKATEYAPYLAAKTYQIADTFSGDGEADKTYQTTDTLSPDAPAAKKVSEKVSEKVSAGCHPTGVTGGRSKPNNPPVSGFRLGSEPSPARARARDPLAETLQAELEQKRAALGLNGGSAPRSVAAVVGGALAAVEAETGKKQTG